MKTKNIILVELFILFGITTIMVLTNNAVSFDHMVYEKVMSVKSSIFDFIYVFVTKCGNTIPVLCVTILCMLLFPKKERYMLGISILSIVGSNQLLKHIIQRVRPDHIRLIEQGGYSYPSGHAMISIALYGFLIYFVYKKVKNKYLKIVLMIGLIFLILGIGISRIYVGVHYPSDILGGYSLALAILIIVIDQCRMRIKGE